MVGGEDDDFEVFVEHVKAPSADDNFGASGRTLDFGGHHSEEELTVGVRPAGVGIEVVESEIALLAVIAHCGDLERLVGIGVCADSVLELSLFASRIERSVIFTSFDCDH